MGSKGFKKWMLSIASRIGPITRFISLRCLVAAGHALYLFVLLFTVLEALFSKDGGGAATKTICKRASSFLGLQPRCTYSDIEKLYNIRSELVHGRREASESGGNLANAHELEFVVTQCMKKMLSERIYLKYRDLADKEQYFNQLTSGFSSASTNLRSRTLARKVLEHDGRESIQAVERGAITRSRRRAPLITLWTRLKSANELCTIPPSQLPRCSHARRSLRYSARTA